MPVSAFALRNSDVRRVSSEIAAGIVPARPRSGQFMLEVYSAPGNTANNHLVPTKNNNKSPKSNKRMFEGCSSE